MQKWGRCQHTHDLRQTREDNAMHIDTYGAPEGTHVWLFHGSGAPPDSLSTLADALSRTFCVHVPHFPGYRDTPYSPDDTLAGSIATLAAHIRDAGSRVVLVGHSFGSYRMIRLLSELGEEHVLGLYGMGGIATMGEEWREGFEGAEAWARSGEGIPQGLAARWFGPGYLEAHDGLIATVEAWWGHCHFEAVGRELFEPLDGGLADGIVAASTCAFTLRVGSQDVAAPPALSHAIAALRPGIDVELVEGVGHFLHMEDAEATLASLEAFISSVS